MLPYSFIGSGQYTNPASPVALNVALTDQPDWFFTRDLTNWGATSTAALPVSAEWFSTMQPGAYLATGQTSNATPSSITLYPTRGTSGGFTFFNTQYPPTYAALAATAINTTTWVVSMANTGSIAVGDWVRVLNPVGCLEAAGIIAQVTAVTANTSITLGYIASAVSAGLTFSSNATSASILKFIPNGFYPKAKQVMFVTQANQATVYFATPNDFTPGEIVDFSIPTAYGMTQLSYLTGKAGIPGIIPPGAARVLTVTNSPTVSSITIAVNTSGFTAFSYPTSTTYSTNASPPWCVPAGSGVVPLAGNQYVPQSPPGTNLLDAFDNRSQYYMNLGVNVVGVANATIEWFAFKADFINVSNA